MTNWVLSDPPNHNIGHEQLQSHKMEVTYRRPGSRREDTCKGQVAPAALPLPLQCMVAASREVLCDHLIEEKELKPS